jgi:DNA-binding SARP family transcriptional activator
VACTLLESGPKITSGTEKRTPRVASAGISVFSWWERGRSHVHAFRAATLLPPTERDVAASEVFARFSADGCPWPFQAAPSMCGYVIGVARDDGPPQLHARFELSGSALQRTEMLQEALSVAMRLECSGLRDAILELVDVPDPALRISLSERALYRDGAPIHVTGREFDVLAAIVLRSPAITTDGLIDRVWPDFDSERGRACLRVLVHRIRARARRRDIVVCEHGRWSLGRGISVDLWDWEALVERARATRCTAPLRAKLTEAYKVLLRLSAAEGSHSALAADVEQTTNALLRKVAAVLIEDGLIRGDTASVLEIARGVLAADPYAEVWHESIVKAHVSIGNDRAARGHLREYATLLRTDLGVELPDRFVTLVGEATA